MIRIWNKKTYCVNDRMPPVQEYLLCLLNYFQWFFETMNNASPKNEQHM